MKIKLSLLILSVLFMASCGGNKKSTDNTSSEKSVISSPDDSQKVVNQAGKRVYDSVCLVCHMADGSGVPGMHPPIYESEFVNGEKDTLIGIIIHGLQGEIKINGEVYNGIMPPQANLTDQQIADVLTYIRSNFGNNSGPVTPEEVQKKRSE